MIRREAEGEAAKREIEAETMKREAEAEAARIRLLAGLASIGPTERAVGALNASLAVDGL